MPRVLRPRRLARWPPAAALVLALAAAWLVVRLTAGQGPVAGYDVSYPQCGGGYPADPRFAIVGVNGGRAGTANPCLASELRWAQGAPGGARRGHEPVSLYIDTANPGARRVASWPRGGASAAYGVCNGLLTEACSYLYGERRAIYSYRLVDAVDAGTARRAGWWLDVELMESWAGTYALNVAALRGFVAGLRAAGTSGPIGVYSTSAQWRDITGLTGQTTPAAFHRPLLGWVAGTAATRAEAAANCRSAGFTGAVPALAQYRLGAFDADLRCPSTH